MQISIRRRCECKGADFGGANARRRGDVQPDNGRSRCLVELAPLSAVGSVTVWRGLQAQRAQHVAPGRTEGPNRPRPTVVYAPDSCHLQVRGSAAQLGHLDQAFSLFMRAVQPSQSSLLRKGATGFLTQAPRLPGVPVLCTLQSLWRRVDSEGLTASCVDHKVATGPHDLFHHLP